MSRFQHLLRFGAVPVVAACLTLAFPATGTGQEVEVQIQTPDGPRTVKARPAVAGQPMPGQPMPGQPVPGAEGQPGAKPEGKPEGEKKAEGDKPKVITRSNTPESPADPKELEVRPDAAGMLRLNFTGQTWPDVLRWLKTVSGKSLDWQELPGDYG